MPNLWGQLVEGEGEKLLRGGIHTTAVLKVRAEVCLQCGERLYSPQTVRRFEEIRAKLEGQHTADDGCEWTRINANAPKRFHSR